MTGCEDCIPKLEIKTDYIVDFEYEIEYDINYNIFIMQTKHVDKVLYVQLKVDYQLSS